MLKDWLFGDKLPIKKGDFVLISYVAKVKEDDKVISTNIKDEAKKANLFEEDRVYEPELVIVGEGWVLKGLDEELEKFEVGEEKVVEIPPEKAFGGRDPKKVRVVPARELSTRGIIPRVNAEVELNGKRAIIRSVGGGRVVLDFNHPLAGKTIVYKVKVVKKLETLEEKALELVHRWIPRISKDKLMVELVNDILEITLPEDVLSYERLGLLQRGVARDIQRYIPTVKTVKFIINVTLQKQQASERAQA